MLKESWKKKKVERRMLKALLGYKLLSSLSFTWERLVGGISHEEDENALSHKDMCDE